MYSVVLLMAMSGAPETPAFCFGCRGCRGCSGCWGCHGCRGGWCGGCYCGGCYCGGCYSCGGCYGYCGGYGYSYHGCHGCYGGTMVVPHKTVTPPPNGKTPPGEVSTSATVRVSLPANATLTIDGSPTRQTSAERLFVSPPLEVGKSYYYTIQAEIQREGKPVSLTKRVSVQAGQTTSVNFDFQTTEVAASQ